MMDIIRIMIVRIYILDLYKQKSQGKLHGKTKEQKYFYYKRYFWKNRQYKKSIFDQYLELNRLYKIQCNKLKIWKNVRGNWNKDQVYIRCAFPNLKGCKYILKILENQGDIHKNGRSVSKIEFDNGSILYYKPHSLDKDIKYQQLYKYLCEKAGISCREVRCLSRQTYGWEENIENKSCNTKEEIERYYFRLGIHLFLGYALGATDLHGENIVAYGEHPVIIDMETYPGYITKNSGSSTEEKAEIKIREKIMTSVLNTGILPVLTWGTGNNRVLMSAVNMHGKIRTPFKMPVVKDDKTSNIHIEYEQVEFEIKECIVRLNGEGEI